MSQENKELSTELHGLIQRLTGEVTALGSSAANGSRQSVIQAAQAIVHAAQDSQELCVYFAVNVTELIVMRLFLDWEAFQEIPLEGSISFADLASKIDAEAGLVARLARMLMATGMLSAEGTGGIAHTRRSRSMAMDPLLRATIKLVTYQDFTAWAVSPEFFAQHGRREPTSKSHNPYSFAMNQPGKLAFDIMLADPNRAAIFAQAMVHTQTYHPTTYDASWLLSDGGNSRQPLLVDVGGGSGAGLLSILVQTPGLDPTRCVLQDRPDMVAKFESLRLQAATKNGGKPENPDPLDGIQTMGIDFHTSQPVKNARAYILRRVLHDYADDDCVTVLAVLRAAMTDTGGSNKGEEAASKVLIMDMLLDPETSPPFCYAMDLGIMGMAGKERTREDWEGIVGRAGMRVDRVVRGASSGAGLAILECVAVGM